MLTGVARAELVTMVCERFTLDIDLTNRSVSFTAGGPRQATVQADISDRQIDFGDPFNTDYKFRVDRMTGIFWWNHNAEDGSGWSGWIDKGSCRRMDKPVL